MGKKNEEIEKDVYDYLAICEERRMASEDADEREWEKYLEESAFEDMVKSIEEGHD